MHKNVKKLAGFCVLAVSPLLAQAEIYICKDASGKTLTSDRPIMECQDRKVRVLGKNGLTAARDRAAADRRTEAAETGGRGKAQGGAGGGG